MASVSREKPGRGCSGTHFRLHDARGAARGALYALERHRPGPTVGAQTLLIVIKIVLCWVSMYPKGARYHYSKYIPSTEIHYVATPFRSKYILYMAT